MNHLMKEIIQNADPKAAHYRYRILYVNTLSFLKRFHPFRIDAVLRDRLSNLKKRIEKTEATILELQQKLAKQKKQLIETCPHPITQLDHSGYAVSGTSKKFPENGAIHEWVKCDLCKHTIHFEAQEACEEYRLDD